MRNDLSLNEKEILAWAEDELLLPPVLLLMRAFDGEYFTEGMPWMVARGAGGHSWVDFHAIPEHLEMVENPKAQGVLMLAASLADVGVAVNLADALQEMEDDTVEYVLAAVAQSVAQYDPDAVPVYPWPGE